MRVVDARPTPGQTEISDLWFKVFVKKNVAAFDVAVDDVVGVKVVQAAGSSQSNVSSSLPAECRCSVFAT